MRSWLKYLVTMVIGLAAAAWMTCSWGLFDQTVAAGAFRILSDAFFVVGAVLTGAGLLVLFTNEGAFDMLAFGGKTLVSMFRKDNGQKRTTFYDYSMKRAEKKVPFGFLLICGVIYLALAVVMLLLYRGSIG